MLLHVQVSFNCLLMDCMAALGQWEGVLAAAEALQRLVPIAQQAPVAAWKAAALAHSSSRVLEGMNWLQAEFSMPEVKVRGMLTESRGLQTGCTSGYQDRLLVWKPLSLDPFDGLYGWFDLAARQLELLHVDGFFWGPGSLAAEDTCTA